jgi:hypothetical protein
MYPLALMKSHLTIASAGLSGAGTTLARGSVRYVMMTNSRFKTARRLWKKQDSCH